MLANLLMAADPIGYAILFPIVERQAGSTVPVFQAGIDKKTAPYWNDPPVHPSWACPEPTLVAKIESALGILNDRFAFCQTLPLDEFAGIDSAMAKCGFRPTRFRPYADDPIFRVAAVWIRDGRERRIVVGLTSEEVRQRDKKNRDG